MTLRAKQCIEQADVLVYDYLCNQEMLKWAPDGAEIIFAGKKAGEHTLSQDEINALLVEKARAEKLVVRLKGGDPFLFGRGAEEALALTAAGILLKLFRACLPPSLRRHMREFRLTHREKNSHVTFFTGHEDPAKEKSSIDFEALARLGGTQVMLMGMERLEAITREMMAHGTRDDLPVALIRWGTTGRQMTLAGKLGDIAKQAREKNFKPPAVAVFGEVVALREKLNWFEGTAACRKGTCWKKNRQAERWRSISFWTRRGRSARADCRRHPF